MIFVMVALGNIPVGNAKDLMKEAVEIEFHN